MKTAQFRILILTMIFTFVIFLVLGRVIIANAGGFNFPIQTDKIYRYQGGMQYGQWYDYQPFGSLFQFSDKIHLGADINRSSQDADVPVHAVNDCTVSSWDDTTDKSDWGKYIILKCDASPGEQWHLSDGDTTNKVYVLYAHLGEIVIYTDLTQKYSASQITLGLQVKKGMRIGTIGNANGFYGTAYHLHFEIRPRGLDQLGYGYQSVGDWSYTQTHTDPLEFISNNRADYSANPNIFVHPYDLEANFGVRMEMDTNTWQRRVRTAEDGAVSFGYGNYLWSKPTNVGTDASYTWTFKTAGWYAVYLYLPRAGASSTNVGYRLWHEGTGNINPYRITISQKSTGVNQRKFIGKFYFSANWKYSLVIDALTSESPSKIMVLDALEFVNVNSGGTGGGLQGGNDQDGDMIEDEWEGQHGLSNGNSSDATSDNDLDGLTALQEYRYDTDPQKADTDGDGFPDGQEITDGTDPTDIVECPACNDDTKQLDNKLYPKDLTPSTVKDHQFSNDENSSGGCASSNGDVGSVFIPLVMLAVRLRRKVV